MSLMAYIDGLGLVISHLHISHNSPRLPPQNFAQKQRLLQRIAKVLGTNNLYYGRWANGEWHDLFFKEKGFWIRLLRMSASLAEEAREWVVERSLYTVTTLTLLFPVVSYFLTSIMACCFHISAITLSIPPLLSMISIWSQLCFDA